MADDSSSSNQSLALTLYGMYGDNVQTLVENFNEKTFAELKDRVESKAMEHAEIHEDDMDVDDFMESQQTFYDPYERRDDDFVQDANTAHIMMETIVSTIGKARESLKTTGETDLRTPSQKVLESLMVISQLRPEVVSEVKDVLKGNDEMIDLLQKVTVTTNVYKKSNPSGFVKYMKKVLPFMSGGRRRMKRKLRRTRKHNKKHSKRSRTARRHGMKKHTRRTKHHKKSNKQKHRRQTHKRRSRKHRR